jgi:hypothetical protein
VESAALAAEAVRVPDRRPGRAAWFDSEGPDAEGESAAVEPAEVVLSADVLSADVLSADAVGIDANAAPTPNATANAPTRPTWRA